MTGRPFSIPSSFLPHLPRSQNSFEPLLTSDLLAHIAILRELYVPPIHGGFEVRDCMADEGDDDDENENARRREEKVAKRERRFSAGLVETMDGLGLGLDVGPTSGSTPSGPGLESVGEEPLGSDEEDGGPASEEEEESREHLDPFERDWSEKWLNGVVRRSQGWLEENEERALPEEVRVMEGLLRDASAALAMMAGTSGSLTRHLLFPLDPRLEPGLKALRPSLLANPSLSPAAQTFLSTLASSPTSPLTIRKHLASSPTTSQTSEPSSSPSTSFAGSLNSHYLPSSSTSRHRPKGKRRPAVPVLLHDAPMQDHLSVGVQTWGSAILLGRRMAKHPDQFGLFDTSRRKDGVRMLELGAGTGLLSILCRKLLDIKAATEEVDGDVTVPSSPGRTRHTSSPGLIVATDFLSEVLDNLRLCVDLNFPTPIGSPSASLGNTSGIHIAKLDWTTFPSFMQRRSSSSNNEENSSNENSNGHQEEEETGRFMNEPFDLVLASDCVYDETHARMLREVASWTLRLPDEGTSDQGGTFHILSPIRPTFTPELESIDLNFPPHPVQGGGEGLGMARGLKLGTRGGKRSMVGRKGEGRIDENAGYWWWEVGWA